MELTIGKLYSYRYTSINGIEYYQLLIPIAINSDFKYSYQCLVVWDGSDVGHHRRTGEIIIFHTANENSRYWFKEEV